MTPGEVLLLAAIGVPLLGAAGALLLRKRALARDAASLLAPLGTAMVALALTRHVGAGVSWPLGQGFAFALRVDATGLLFATLASALWLLVAVYSLGYLPRHGEPHARARYHASFALVLAATMGVAFASNLLTLVAWYEVISVSAFALVIHDETDAAFDAGRKYLRYTLAGGAALACALGVLYAGGASLDLAPGGNATLAAVPDALARAAALLLVGGFAVKATLMPLHGWLPSAMVAPTPVSGLLHAVAVVVAGAFGLVRALHDYLGPSLAIASGARALVLAAAVVTIVAASLFALLQDEIKLRLAYSTIGQLSYIALGAALFTPAALEGAGLQIAAHSLAKLALFLCAGVFAVQLGVTRVSQLDGAAKRAPWTAAAFAISALALVGLPPLAPSLARAALESSVGLPLAALLVASSLLNAAYFLPMIVRAYRRDPTAVASRAREPTAMLAPILVLSLLTLALAVVPALAGSPRDLAARAAGVSPLALDWRAALVALAVFAAGALGVALATGTRIARGSAYAIRVGLDALSSGARGLNAGLARAGTLASSIETEDTNVTVAALAGGLLAALAWLAWGATA